MPILKSITPLVDVWVFGVGDTTIRMNNYIVLTAINNCISLRSNYPFIFSTFNQNITICKYSHLAAILYNHSFVLLVFILVAIDFSIFVVTEEFILSYTENEIIFDRIQ